MVNQRGQAFSVFELMIAGVVAFAILMVLMQVIGGVLTGQDTDAISAISSTIKAVQPSGQDNTGNFVLKKNIDVDATDLAMSTDLDEGSFIFYDNYDLKELESGDGTYIKYIGSQQKYTLSALIICKPTAEKLSDSVVRLNEYSISSSGECEEGLVCCAVIPMKRVN